MLEYQGDSELRLRILISEGVSLDLEKRMKIRQEKHYREKKEHYFFSIGLLGAIFWGI